MKSRDQGTDSTPKPTVPEPADPQRRSERLPWEQPKAATEDPLAGKRVRALMRSPSYLPAVLDTEFLGVKEARGMRLGLDYLKPETLLRQHGVEHTIVVFGSTRIPEPKAAERRLAAARAAARRSPGDPALMQRLEIAERIAANASYYDVAREFGELVGRSGEGPEDCRLVLMTGGGPGIMEAANRGAGDVGADSIGLNITLPREQYPNPYITPGLCFSVHYFSTRKLHFLLRAKALVVFPGGFGTLDELFETLTLVQTRKIEPLPIALVGASFWRKAIDLDYLVTEGVIDIEDRDLLWYAETASDIWQGIVQWHRAAGTDFLFEQGGSTTPGE